MTSPYTPRPALKTESGVLVFLNVQKRFPGFLRCNALHFLDSQSPPHSELAVSPVEFRNAVARLPASPILGPISGGVPLVIYLAARGLEEDFKELADEISEAGLSRLYDLPSRDLPVVVVFGDAELVEDQVINPPVTEMVRDVPTRPILRELDPTPEPVAPPAPPTPQPEPVSVIELATAPEPGPEPAPAPVEIAPPAVEPAPVVELAPPTIGVQPEPASAPIPTPPAAAPVPEPEPVAFTPASSPEPEPASASTPMPEPMAASQTTHVTTAPTFRGPLALLLGNDYYALRTPDASGSTVVVWHARRLRTQPSSSDYEILEPSTATYQRLLADAASNVHYADQGQGELVAIKVAVPGAEAQSEQALSILGRVGPRALQLYYPANAILLSDFPAYVVEWVTGSSVTDSPAFSEAIAFDLTGQLLDLLAAARAAAPDVVLTSGLKPSNVIVAYDDRGSARARIIDWNDYAADDDTAANDMQRRLGELMADLFADMSIDASASLEGLGVGTSGNSVINSWDGLSHTTRKLIATALRAGFEGNADAVIAAMVQVVKEQRHRWAESDSLWNARLAQPGADRLTWLDIAATKQGGLSSDARERLTTQRAAELRNVLDAYTDVGHFDEAVLQLRSAVRQYPAEAYFRWALLANAAAQSAPEGAYQRLRLGEALAYLGAGNYGEARTALEHGSAFFDEIQFEADRRERARDAVLALSMCAQSLALCDSAMNALNDSWNVEEAEARLGLAEDRQNRYEKLAAGVLTGHDPVCQQRIAAVRTAINEFYTKHGRYDPYVARRETTEQSRRASFNRQMERGWKLAQTADKPDAWNAALLAFDRSASDYPDLWKEDHERERGVLVEKISRRKLVDGRQALGQGNWAAAGAALATAMQYPATSGEAARLQAALWAYQRGEVELQRGELSSALSSFTFAADHSEELKANAEARAQTLREQGAEHGGDAMSRELTRRFADQQNNLRGTVQAAALAAQQQGISQQIDALRQLQEEQGQQSAAATRLFADDQEMRLNALLNKMRQELATTQEAAVQRSQEEQVKQLRTLLVSIHDEDIENQRTALEAMKKEQAKHFEDLQLGSPQWFAKAQRDQKKAADEQEEKLNAALKSLENTVEALRTNSAKAEAAAREQGTNDPVSEGALQDLGLKMESNTHGLKSLQGRLGLLTALNLLLLLCLLGIVGTAAAYAFLPNVRAMLPSGNVAQVTTVPATSVPVAGATDAVPQPTTVATTQAAASGDAISCVGIDQARSFFDCTVTNVSGESGEFGIMIKPLTSDVQGFFYGVTVDGQSIQPAPGETQGETLFNIGSVRAGEAMPVRVSVACVSAGGCTTTPFAVSLMVDGSDVPVGELQVMSPP